MSATGGARPGQAAVGPAEDAAVARFSAAAARRIALAAQGFDSPRPSARVDVRHLRRVIDRVALLQLDSVNVFSRSHYVPLFSRLGAYPTKLIDRMAAHDQPPVRRSRRAAGEDLAGAVAGAVARPVAEPVRRGRELFEYWAHEASLLPFSTQPLMRWRMADADGQAWGNMVGLARRDPQLIERVRELVRERGPMRAAETGIARPKRVAGGMWNWHEGKVALEYLFFTGAVTAAERVRFERRYDLAERALPAAVLEEPTPAVEDAQRELVKIAARALGVAAEPDLGDYFRLPRTASKTRVAELVQTGELVPVDVEGWNVPAYLWPEAKRPRAVTARALLSPFDSLVWFRPRAERLFGFRYRIEIYVPKHKR
ncbi:MAG TPA: crosslink repair DNA glycosylase YcaQ family protein, partial [Solirubrobacteraceae bacterium]|nr:crosslink repair DNA glycosylase YcaQ family protein [Solirubrobacteraceae bacterium]